MSRPPSEEERFLANVLDLSDLVHELTTICWDEGVKDVNPILVLGARAYLSGYNKIDLLETFITYSNEYWEEIKSRNENFFIEHAKEIFKHLPVKQSNISAFKLLFTAKNKDGEYIVESEDRDAIWDMFDSLVKICIKYIHRKRKVQLVETEEGQKPIYSSNYLPDIKVRELAREWGITLELPDSYLLN